MQNNTRPQNGALPNVSPTAFDYTFTDKELQDILGFMELQQQGGHEPATSTPPFFPASSPNGLGLQFQPHPPPIQSGSTVAVQPYDQSQYVGVRGDAASSSSAYSSGFGAARGVPLVMGHPGIRTNSFAHAPSSSTDKQPSLQQTPSFGVPSSKVDRGSQSLTATTVHRSLSSQAQHCHLTEPKQHVSHSTVEKQRRDRINSLIDEVGQQPAHFTLLAV